MPDCNSGIRVKFVRGAVFREYGYETSQKRELKVVWHGKLLAYSHKPVYLGVTLYRSLAYKDHIAKTKANNPS